VIRGGSHLDFSFIPNQAFGASYYGPDITDWYITAWFDKYLKHAPGADSMLLSDRWRQYAPEAAIDPNHDGNALSFYYYSRLDIHLAGGQPWACEDLRAGCAGMVPASQDGYTGNYSYDAIDTSPDAVLGPAAKLKVASALTACTARSSIRIHLRSFHHHAITSVTVYVDRHLVLKRRGRALRIATIPGLPGRGRHRIRVYEYAGRHLVRIETRIARGCARR
jgi:hypothetical protein